MKKESVVVFVALARAHTCFGLGITTRSGTALRSRESRARRRGHAVFSHSIRAMKRPRFLTSAAGWALALVGACLNANAATIIAVNPEPSTGGGGLALAYLYGADPFATILAVGWTSSLSFSAVTVTAELASSNPVALQDAPSLRLDSEAEQRPPIKSLRPALFFRLILTGITPGW
jgi:hypothetical protein